MSPCCHREGPGVPLEREQSAVFDGGPLEVVGWCSGAVAWNGVSLGPPHRDKALSPGEVFGNKSSREHG